MRTINPLHMRAVMDMINQGPYFQLLSMTVTSLEDGYARVEVDMQRKHLNPFGGVHGGVYSSLIDTAAYWAIYCDIDEESGFISLDVSVTNLAPARAGHLVVEGKRIKAGRSVCIAEASVFDDQGRCLAYGTSKQLVTPGLQTINQAVAALGFTPLPPKFIP